MIIKNIKPGTYVGERALYNISYVNIEDSIFEDGESPLKECHNLTVKNTEFRWKYPLWYCENIYCENIRILETARSGIWYTKNITIENSFLDAPKYFRRCDGVTLNNVDLMHGQEIFWGSKNIVIKNMKAKGDYFAMNVDTIEVDNLYLDGNYAFDGAKNVIIRNSILNSKDSFWNTENVTVYDSKIIGEYLAWNSKNVTFINCEVESNQGLCYIDKLTIRNTSLNYTDLCFELCSNIDAEVTSHVISIKNPISGKIRVKSVGEIILDERMIDPKKTEIIVDEKI